MEKSGKHRHTERKVETVTMNVSYFVWLCLLLSTQLNSHSQFLTEAEREIGKKVELTLIQYSL